MTAPSVGEGHCLLLFSEVLAQEQTANKSQAADLHEVLFRDFPWLIPGSVMGVCV